MSSKLQKLITHYEAEQATLKTQIDECVGEMEFGTARRLAKGLFLVQDKLQTLHRFQDKFYDKKQVIARLIEALEKGQAESGSSYPLKYMQEQIAAKKQRITELEEAQKAAGSAPESAVLRDALLQLLAGTIAQFELMIDGEQKLYCNIRLVRKTLVITVPEIRRHRQQGLFRKKQVRLAINLGFRLYDNRDKLMLFLPYANKEEIAHVKRILAQLLFEVLYFEGFMTNSYLRYWENTLE